MIFILRNDEEKGKFERAWNEYLVRQYPGGNQLRQTIQRRVLALTVESDIANAIPLQADTAWITEEKDRSVSIPELLRKGIVLHKDELPDGRVIPDFSNAQGHRTALLQALLRIKGEKLKNGLYQKGSIFVQANFESFQALSGLFAKLIEVRSNEKFKIAA